MDDVDTDDLADGRVLSYDSSSEKLKFVDQSGGGAGYANTAGISTYAITAGIALIQHNSMVKLCIILS